MHMQVNPGIAVDNVYTADTNIVKRMRFKRLLMLLLFFLLGATGCATTGEMTARHNIEQHIGKQKSAAPHDSPAEDTIPDGSLGSYIAYSMKNSPALQAQFERWQASVYRISQSRRLPEPVISYAYYVSRVETRVGPQRHKVSLKQTFPWPTRLAAGADAASARSRAQQERFDAMAIAIASKVEQTYWRIWEIQTTRKIHVSHELVLEGLSESVNAGIMTGRIELADQQQIDLSRARVEDLLFMLDEQRAQQEAGLRGIISAPADMPIAITSAPDFPLDFTDGTIHEASLLSSVKNHPRLRAYVALAQSSALDAQKEETSRYPNFTVGIDWIETGKAQSPDVSDSGKDAFIAGIGVSIPLWQRSYQDSVDAYRADEKAHLADGQAATDRAVSALYQTVSQLRDAKRRMTLYEKTLVPQAESVYTSVLGAYASGRGNVASSLLAQQDLLDLRVQLIHAQADYLDKFAVLKNIVGHERPQTLSQTQTTRPPGPKDTDRGR